MLLLALETSSLAGSVALLEDDACRAVAEFQNGRQQGREVLLQSGKLLEGLGVSPIALDAIAVGSGPGSYTGIRVGVTAAKTLSLALRRPLLGESSLKVMAAGPFLGDPGPGGPSGNGGAAGGGEAGRGAGPRFIATMLDGRQKYLYGALFRLRPGAAGGRDTGGRSETGEVVEYLVRDRVGDAAEFSELFETCLSQETEPAEVTVIGDGAELFLSRVEGGGGACLFTRGPPAWDNPRAEALGRLSAARAPAARFDPAATHGLNPAYLRPTEAQRKLMAK